MVKLANGCYGVTRSGEVVGPFRPPTFTLMTAAPIRPDFVTGEPGRKRFHNEAGVACHKQFGDIIAVFPSRAAAESWLNRPVWWKRVAAFLHSRRPHLRDRMWWNGWGYGMIASGVIQGVLLALALLLTACDNPTAPRPEYKCYNDGTPIDCETGKPINTKPTRAGITSNGGSTQGPVKDGK